MLDRGWWAETGTSEGFTLYRVEAGEISRVHMSILQRSACGCVRPNLGWRANSISKPSGGRRFKPAATQVGVSENILCVSSGNRSLAFQAFQFKSFMSFVNMFGRDYPDHQEDLGSDRDSISQHPSWDGWSLRL